jgi:thiol-disulfide isomerase/thioredoxin
VKAVGTMHLIGVLGLVLAFALAPALQGPASGTEARPTPDYRARILGSEDVADLASLKGKVVLLNTWATWCAPCRVEMPDFEAFYLRYRDRGLEVVAVNIDEGEVDEKVERFTEKMGITFTIWRDPRNRFAKKFRVLGVPATLLISRDGMILRHWNGPMNPADPENLKSIELALGSGGEPADKRSQDKAALQRGRRIAEQRGCLNCHTTDGSKNVGPTFKGMLGAEVTLTDGRTFTRDEDYLKRAILDPDAETVAGYDKGVMSGAMPGKKLTEEEVDALVLYLKSL